MNGTPVISGEGNITMRAVSLTTKLLGICSGTLVIMFAACLFMFLKAEEHQSEAVRREFLTLANDMESKIGMQFFDRYADVVGFAQNSLLQTKNTPEIAKALNTYINVFQTYDLIVLVDMNGQVIASNTVDFENKAIDVSPLLNQNLASSAWFTNTVNERFTEDASKKLTGVYVEDIMIDPVTTGVYHGKRIGLSFSTPVRDDKGKMVAVLSVRSSLRWIEQEFMDLYKHLRESGLESMEMTMTNKKGEVVIDYDPSYQNANNAIVHDYDNILLKWNLVNAGQAGIIAALQGREGTTLAKHTRRGYRALGAYTDIKDEKFIDELGWCLLFQVEDDVLLGSILQAKQLFLLVSGLVLAFCVIGSGFFAVRLSQRLKRISNNIAQSGGTVDSVSHQLSDASQDLSSGATEVASSLQETVSSLEELTSMVKTNADNAGEAASLAQSSSRIAKEGESEVQNLIGAISEINQSSKKIEEIINVIDDIAFQTNLLALNAAVEAARAGEQGKGFAVVAEAVRNLAQRSGTAAKEITSLISDNVDKIDRGTRIADRSGQVLQNILSSVRKVADLNNEIAAASKEQSSGLSQISKAMNEIDQATQRNAAASEEVASSSEEMSHQAATLQNMVNDLSHVVTGKESQSPAVPAPAVATQRTSNVMPLKRPPVRQARRAAPAASTRTHAETVIPFDDESNDEPKAKIGSTAGF